MGEEAKSVLPQTKGAQEHFIVIEERLSDAFGRVREALYAMVREPDPAAGHQHPVADVRCPQARHQRAERQAEFVMARFVRKARPNFRKTRPCPVAWKGRKTPVANVRSFCLRSVSKRSSGPYHGSRTSSTSIRSTFRQNVWGISIPPSWLASTSMRTSMPPLQRKHYLSDAGTMLKAYSVGAVMASSTMPSCPGCRLSGLGTRLTKRRGLQQAAKGVDRLGPLDYF
jgi:hypothetical protein